MFAEYIDGLRQIAEVDFADTFTAYSFEWEKVDGLDEQTWVHQGDTSGKIAGRSRDGDTNTRTVNVGGLERPVVEGGLHIPLGAPLPAIGWEYVCTATGPASDPALLRRRWRVIDVPAKSYATARRLDVVEVPTEEA